MSDNTPDDVRGLQGKAPYSAIAREALKVIAALQAQLDAYQLRNADLAGLNVDLKQKLDAKDTEIAWMRDNYNTVTGELHQERRRLRAQIAERDATIALHAEDRKAMWTALTEILGNSDDYGARDCALDCLQSLKEPNP